MKKQLYSATTKAAGSRTVRIDVLRQQMLDVEHLRKKVVEAERLVALQAPSPPRAIAPRLVDAGASIVPAINNCWRKAPVSIKG